MHNQLDFRFFPNTAFSLAHSQSHTQNYILISSLLWPMSSHELTLKAGTVVMLLRNLNPMKGLLNGMRLIVKSMYQHCLDLEIITGRNVGQRVL